MRSRRILLVDDDEAFRESLAEQLRFRGEFDTVCAGTGAAALDAAEAGRFDLVLLDTGLPDMDGHEVCRRLRLSGVDAPAILLGEADAPVSPGSGGCERIAKPLRLNVLLARIRAHLPTRPRGGEEAFAVGGFSFRPAAGMLVDAQTGARVRLTGKEAAILERLSRAEPAAVSRDTLLDEVWGYNSGVSTHTLETHIYRLRQKIERDPATPGILVTENGSYRLATCGHVG